MTTEDKQKKKCIRCGKELSDWEIDNFIELCEECYWQNDDEMTEEGF